jgi:Domain of unknown function (DUF4396)
VQPTWLLILSWVALAAGLTSAAVIVVDESVLGYRQPVRILEVVWPVTALYFGPETIAAYRKWGRPQSLRWRERHGDPPKKLQNPALLHLRHCGAHCTLGAIIATVITFAIGINVSGEREWPEYIADYVAALAMGILFRYSAEPRTGGSRVWAAMRIVVKADLLTVSAFELALLVWLILVHDLVFPAAVLRANNPVFWFILQIGLIIGFFAAWPASSWLIRRGVAVEPRASPSELPSSQPGGS